MHGGTAGYAEKLGAGVEALGLMIMAFSLAQLVASPFMGTLADRFGRRPWILVALAAFALANVGYLIAQSTLMFILVRAVAGALTAGLFPAAMAGLDIRGLLAGARRMAELQSPKACSDFSASSGWPVLPPWCVFPGWRFRRSRSKAGQVGGGGLESRKRHHHIHLSQLDRKW